MIWSTAFLASSGGELLRLPERAGAPPSPVDIEGGRSNLLRRNDGFAEAAEVEETLSLVESERELIRRALVKHGHRRKQAAAELGISERTLYRKIKEFGLK